MLIQNMFYVYFTFHVTHCTENLYIVLNGLNGWADWYLTQSACIIHVCVTCITMEHNVSQTTGTLSCQLAWGVLEGPVRYNMTCVKVIFWSSPFEKFSRICSEMLLYRIWRIGRYVPQALGCYFVGSWCTEQGFEICIIWHIYFHWDIKKYLFHKKWLDLITRQSP